MLDEPPIPTLPYHELIPDGDGFIEFDADGVPLGRWEYDGDEGVWIFNEFPPLGELPTGDLPTEELPKEELPNTGGSSPYLLMLALFIGLTLMSIGLWLRRKEDESVDETDRR